MAEPQYLAVSGPPPTRLAFVDVGPRDAPPVLLIHGVGGWHGQWAAQLDALAGRFRCIAPTLPGHLPSEVGAGPWTLARLGGDLQQLLQARGVAGPVAIVSHSYGGIVALNLALHQPELVSRLVVLGLAEQMNFGTLFRAVALLPLPNGPLDLARRLWFADRFHAPVRVLRGIMREAVLPWKGWAALRAIRTPTLLLAGQYDVVAPPYMVRPLATRLPNAQCAVITGARHKLHLQQPEQVNRLITNFLARGQARQSRAR